MTYETDGARGLPQNVLSCGAGKTGQTLPDGCGTDPELLAHIKSARSKGKGPASNDDVAEVWRLMQPTFERMASKETSTSRKSTPSLALSSSTAEAHNLGENDERFLELQTISWEMTREAILGHDDPNKKGRYWTGMDSKGNPVSFEKHVRKMFKYEILQKRGENASCGVPRTTYNRWRGIVEEAHPYGVVDESAISVARQRVIDGLYEGVITLETFDKCWEDTTPMSLDSENEDGLTLYDLIPDKSMNYTSPTPVQQVAMETFESLGPLQQDQFGRATGYYGEKETHRAIGESMSKSGQAVGQNVEAYRTRLKSAIEDYQYDNGLPEYEP